MSTDNEITPGPGSTDEIRPVRETGSWSRAPVAVLVMSLAVAAATVKIFLLVPLLSAFLVVAIPIGAMSALLLCEHLFYSREVVVFRAAGEVARRRWWNGWQSFEMQSVESLVLRDVEYGSRWSTRHVIVVARDGRPLCRFSARWWSDRSTSAIAKRIAPSEDISILRVTIGQLRREFPSLVPLWLEHWLVLSIVAAIAASLGVAAVLSR